MSQFSSSSLFLFFLVLHIVFAVLPTTLSLLIVLPVTLTHKSLSVVEALVLFRPCSILERGTVGDCGSKDQDSIS